MINPEDLKEENLHDLTPEQMEDFNALTKQLDEQGYQEQLRGTVIEAIRLLDQSPNAEVRDYKLRQYCSNVMSDLLPLFGYMHINLPGESVRVATDFDPDNYILLGTKVEVVAKTELKKQEELDSEV